MRYQPYGQTGKKVSRLGFGGMRFDLSRGREHNAALVHEAFRRGINYFDTAPDYCDGESEALFGEAFRTLKGEYYVSTKSMPTDAPTADLARRAVEASLKKLGVPKIHFFHIWCIRHMDHYRLAMQKGGQYEGLLKCRDEGLIDHIVLSSHQPGHEIRQIAEEGRVEGILMGLNILNFPYRWEGATAAARCGLGVVTMNPLGGGLIPRNEDKLGFLAQPGETPTEAALRFNLSSPPVTVSLVGFSSVAEIDAACRIADAARPFGAAELQRLRENLSANMNQACTYCGYCEKCPHDIPVSRYMQFYNRKAVFGGDVAAMVAELDEAYEWGILVGHRGDAARCVACGVCEEACTQRLAIMARLKDISSWERVDKPDEM